MHMHTHKHIHLYTSAQNNQSLPYDRNITPPPPTAPTPPTPTTNAMKASLALGRNNQIFAFWEMQIMSAE